MRILHTYKSTNNGKFCDMSEKDVGGGRETGNLLGVALITVAQKGHPSLQFFEVTFCKLAVFQFCTFANMQFVNQAL